MTEDDVTPTQSVRRAHSLRCGLYLLGFVAVYLLAVCTPIGQEIDAASFSGLVALRVGTWLSLYNLRTELTVLLLLGALVAVIVAAVCRRILDALLAAGLVVLTEVFLIVMANALVRPDLGDHGYPSNTFPSGHLAMSLAAAVAIQRLWVRRLDHRLFLITAAAVLFVGWASLMSFAHRASDMIGAVLLVGILTEAIATVRPPPVLVTRTFGTWLAGRAAMLALAVAASCFMLARLLSRVTGIVIIVGYAIAVVTLVGLVLTSGGVERSGDTGRSG